MVWLLVVVGLLSFFSIVLIGRQLTKSQHQHLAVEHLKARIGLVNHYVEQKRSESECWWCSLGRLVGPKSNKELETTRIRLISAGYRDEKHLGAYFFLKFSFILSMFLLALGLWTWFQVPIHFAMMLPIFAILLPERILILFGNKRLNRIKLALPDFLDMANICMSAGLSYLVAIKRVSEELHEIYPEICFEFNHLLDQIQIGVPRQEALQQFAERNPSDDVKELVQVLIQNEKLGSPIGAAINEFSRRMYQQREHMMEEKAAKTSAKMAVVIMPFLMMPYFILMLGEQMVKFGRSL